MLETGSVKCPTPHVSEPLPLCKVEVRKRADVRGVNHRRQIYGALASWQLPIGWRSPKRQVPAAPTDGLGMAVAFRTGSSSLLGRSQDVSVGGVCLTAFGAR